MDIYVWEHGVWDVQAENGDWDEVGNGVGHWDMGADGDRSWDIDGDGNMDCACDGNKNGKLDEDGGDMGGGVHGYKVSTCDGNVNGNVDEDLGGGCGTDVASIGEILCIVMSIGMILAMAMWWGNGQRRAVQVRQG